MYQISYAESINNNSSIKLINKVTISKEEREWVTSLPVIHFLTGEAPPLSMLSDNKKDKVGIAVDVLDFIANEIGLKYSIDINDDLSLVNNIRAVQNGDVDGFLPLSKNIEREQRGIFTHPFYSSVYAIITKETNNIYIKDLNDLKKYKIGYFKGFVLEEQLRQKVPKELLYPIASNMEEDLYDALYDGKVDAVIHNKDMFLEHKYRHHHFDLKTVYSLYDYPRRYRIYFHKNETNQKLVDIFNRYIPSMDISGSYSKHKIGEKILIEEYVEQKNKQLAFRLFLFFVLFILITIAFFYRKNIKIAQELYQTNLKLQNLYGTDTLTSLPNRNKLNEVLKQEYDNYIKNKSVLSVLFIDADFFKKINDTYGHDVGDRYLIKIADALRKSIIKTSGFVARYGGEEFICLISNSSHELALEIANKIQEEVAILDLDNPASETTKQTVSIGVVTLKNEMIRKHDIISQADNQLYKAKRTGRNKICDIVI